MAEIEHTSEENSIPFYPDHVRFEPDPQTCPGIRRHDNVASGWFAESYGRVDHP